MMAVKFKEQQQLLDEQGDDASGVIRELAAVKQEYHDFRQKNLNAEQQITDLKKELRFYFNEGETNKENAERFEKEASEQQNQVEKLTLQLKVKENELEHATKHSHLYY